jgi:Na+/H+-dicarboxylate symporter
MSATAPGWLGRVYARWTGLGLTPRILLGLALGVLIGLFFGEDAKALQGAASAYIGLMQMTVIPYLLVALILGLGRLEPGQARLLARYAGVALLVFWALTLTVVALMPLTFPQYESAFFFSTAVLEPPQAISFVDLYIPANPFHSLANSIVPAVTLFAAAIGAALITLEEKERFLAPLDVLMKAIARVTGFVVELTPIGVIPVAAVAAGTLSPEELSRLQVYFVTFIVAAVLVGFVLLPLFVTAVTPFRYREVVGTCRDAILTAFVTHSVFIVLPMIAERCEELARKHGLDPQSARSVPEVIVPIAFNFPTAGKLLTLLFVPFAAWLSGSPLEPSSYPGLLTTGLFTYFAKAQVALPFLMDLVEVPQDLFQLYIPTTLVNGKFDSAVGALSLFAFALVTAAAMAGRLRFDAVGLGRFALLSVAAVGVSLFVTRIGLDAIVDTTYTKAEALQAMHLSRSPPPTAVYTRVPPTGAYASRDLDPLERIRERRTLRIGYFQDRLPFTFFNGRRELVGFDVEMAAQMAEDLGVGIEWVPVDWTTFGGLLATGAVDLVPSVPYMHRTVGRITLSAPYTDGTVGLLVRDSRRNEFVDVIAMREQEFLRIGVTADPSVFEVYVAQMLGDTPHELVQIDRLDPAFSSPSGPLDAVLVIAEEGMAWSLVNPDYTVVVPKDRHLVRRPLAYAMAPQAGNLTEFVNEWLVLQRARGGIDAAYQFWILGQGAETRKPRWSIKRDVLGWD